MLNNESEIIKLKKSMKTIAIILGILAIYVVIMPIMSLFLIYNPEIAILILIVQISLVVVFVLVVGFFFSERPWKILD